MKSKESKTKRTEPGAGPLVMIYVAAPKEDAVPRALSRGPSKMKIEGETALCLSVGEDYADSAWPIVVKVKGRISPRELSNSLRDLARAVDRGLYTNIEHEK